MKKQVKIPLFSWKKTLVFLQAILFFTPTAYSAQTLKENIFLAKEGDYAVLGQGKQKFFFLIRAAQPHAVWIEVKEFTHLSPREASLLKTTPWKQAIHELTSYKRNFLIYLSSQTTLYFRFHSKENTWYPLKADDTLPTIANLLQLPLNQVPQNLRKTEGKDLTPWSPRISLEGRPPIKIPSQALSTSWPKDTSMLSGKEILMYLASPDISVFPLWIHIPTPTGSITFRTLEIGHNATSTNQHPLPLLPMVE